MTWKDFFNTIKDSGLFGNIPAKQIIVRLFKAAGNMKEFSEDTAQSWIDNKRNCKTSKYFPNGKLNNECDAIKFYKTTPRTMLMYGKEASNRKQEIDRQHHTIPNQRNQRQALWNCA